MLPPKALPPSFLLLQGFFSLGKWTFLSQVRDHPKEPFLLILGGAKVSDKIGVIEHLMDKVPDHPHRGGHGLYLLCSPRAPGGSFSL